MSIRETDHNPTTGSVGMMIEDHNWTGKLAINLSVHQPPLYTEAGSLSHPGKTPDLYLQNRFYSPDSYTNSHAIAIILKDSVVQHKCILSQRKV